MTLAHQNLDQLPRETTRRWQANRIWPRQTQQSTRASAEGRIPAGD